MPEISTQALIISIQAVAAEFRSLQEAIQNGEAEQEEYALLEKRQRATENLKAAYDELAVNVLNLPLYEQLTSG